MNIPNDLQEIDMMVYKTLTNEDRFLFSSESYPFYPSYSTCIREAWKAAEKVNLFESIITVKKRNSTDWVAYKRGIEQPFLFGKSESEVANHVDFLDLEPIAKGKSLPEVICRSILFLNGESHERTKDGNQQSPSLF